MFSNWLLCSSHSNPPCIVAEVQDPICLKHFGCQEILNKIDLMEGEYDLPMRFNESLIPDSPAAAGENIGEWGYGVAVYSAARGHARPKKTPSLMADMYGFVLRGGNVQHQGLSSLTWGISVRTGRCQVTGHFVVFEYVSTGHLGSC